MPSDRDASISDAAFREAVKALATAHVPISYLDTVQAIETRVATARDKVLALYAEREGEEYEVLSRYLDSSGGAQHVLMVRLDPRKHEQGDRVRVSRCEEGE